MRCRKAATAAAPVEGASDRRRDDLLGRLIGAKATKTQTSTQGRREQRRRGRLLDPTSGLAVTDGVLTVGFIVPNRDAFLAFSADAKRERRLGELLIETARNNQRHGGHRDQKRGRKLQPRSSNTSASTKPNRRAVRSPRRSAADPFETKVITLEDARRWLDHLPGNQVGLLQESSPKAKAAQQTLIFEQIGD